MFILNDLYTCGGIENLGFDPLIPQLVTTGVNIIKIVVPILLIVFGMLDLGRAVMAQKEDEIKKGQQTFIKRLISAVIVFLVFFVVQIIVGLVTTGEEKQSIWNCVDCFINYSDSNSNCEVAN